MFRVNLPLYSYFARLSPAQTERLVACLRADGHRVGFVADKLDSLPAMLEGDVGYALETSETGEERNAPVVSGDIRAADSGAALRYLSDIVLLRPRIRSYGGFCALVGSVRGAVQTYRNLLPRCVLSHCRSGGENNPRAMGNHRRQTAYDRASGVVLGPCYRLCRRVLDSASAAVGARAQPS